MYPYYVYTNGYGSAYLPSVSPFGTTAGIGFAVPNPLNSSTIRINIPFGNNTTGTSYSQTRQDALDRQRRNTEKQHDGEMAEFLVKMKNKGGNYTQDEKRSLQALASKGWIIPSEITKNYNNTCGPSNSNSYGGNFCQYCGNNRCFETGKYCSSCGRQCEN